VTKRAKKNPLNYICERGGGVCAHSIVAAIAHMFALNSAMRLAPNRALIDELISENAAPAAPSRRQKIAHRAAYYMQMGKRGRASAPYDGVMARFLAVSAAIFVRAR
jgi:hypothetical protein